MTEIRNTAKADAIENLVVAMNPGGIEAQEAAGQRELLTSTVLPVQGSNDPRFTELGFTFGDTVRGDELFREATLPDGWTREGSDHAMHSYICDERGIRRVNIFYKAAFYDRRASMHVLNVGSDIATQWIYGDDQSPALPARLTFDELDDARLSAEDYLAQAADDVTGHIYADRAPRAQALLKAVAR